jgi:hypothetical protein
VRRTRRDTTRSACPSRDAFAGSSVRQAPLASVELGERSRRGRALSFLNGTRSSARERGGAIRRIRASQWMPMPRRLLGPSPALDVRCSTRSGSHRSAAPRIGPDNQLLGGEHARRRTRHPVRLIRVDGRHRWDEEPDGAWTVAMSYRSPSGLAREQHRRAAGEGRRDKGGTGWRGT